MIDLYLFAKRDSHTLTHIQRTSHIATHYAFMYVLQLQTSTAKERNTKKKNHRVSMHLSCKRRLRYEYCRFDLLYTAIGFKKTWIGFDASKRIK